MALEMGQQGSVPFTVGVRTLTGLDACSFVPQGQVQGARKSPNPQVAVYLLPVCMAPSPIFLSTSAFPGQAFVSPSGGSFFSSFKKMPVARIG
jgi:hypothetical protein